MLSSGAAHDHEVPAQNFNRVPKSPSKSRTPTDENPSFSTVEMLSQMHGLTNFLPGIQAVARLAPTNQLVDELAELGMDKKLAILLARAIRLDQEE